MYRHGDLLITRINAVPHSAISIPGKVIAKGEVTGHKHRLVGQATVRVLEGSENGTKDTIMKRVKNGSINIFPELYFSASEDVKLVHQEHKTLELPSGSYKVTKEREFNPFEDLETGVLD
tara:strand:- start:500 stop:859 length:360 start_codon:yes stop_codon:yes gene_type:complete